MNEHGKGRHKIRNLKDVDLSTPTILNKNSDKRILATLVEGQDYVFVGRGSIYGNPFIIDIHGDRNHVCDQYSRYVLNRPGLITQIERNLPGKHLVCYCAPYRCHAETLMKIANSPHRYSL
jgi:hypothetical protein